MEEHGPEWIVRARLVWKTKDPAIANERLDGVIDLVARRPGGRAVALAQDATNEKYYAEDNRKRLRRKVPVILVVASEGVDKPGLDKPTNYKEYLGDALVGKLDDNNLTLPADRYTRTDYRLVMKDRGKFVCEPNDEGMHGDTFDGDKLGGFAPARRCRSDHRAANQYYHYTSRPGQQLATRPDKCSRRHSSLDESFKPTNNAPGASRTIRRVWRHQPPGVTPSRGSAKKRGGYSDTDKNTVI